MRYIRICSQSWPKMGKLRFHVPFGQRCDSPQAANPAVQTAAYHISFHANVYYEISERVSWIAVRELLQGRSQPQLRLSYRAFWCGRFRHFIPPVGVWLWVEKRTLLLFRGNVLFGAGKQPAYAVFIFVANLTPPTV